ncbi:MAG TPA: hypothetical protein VEW48_14700 [Thermoanaerobaculia bacterium]|nr:hypothetical protein [Thermoanaerobaculia bacterium]
MRINQRLLSILLLTMLATAASAQEVSVSDLLDQQLENIVGARTFKVTGDALVLALAEAQAMSESKMAPNLGAAINRQRTDFQVAATSDSPHATSVLEKPGIADLLSLALDRGAITKAANGTGLTLSTTPYAIWTRFGATDTPQLWAHAGWARNLSLSATFSSSDVTTGDFSSFTSGEAKYVITGNRSPRDPELLRSVRKDLGAKFSIADSNLHKNCDPLENSKPLFDVQGEVNRWLQNHQQATKDEVRAHIFGVVGGLDVDRTLLKTCVDAILSGEKLIQPSLADVTAATQKYLKAHRNQFSVAALYVRDETLSDYYSGKLLYGHDFAPLSFNLNAEASWNQNSETTEGAELRSLRAYSVELGLNSNTLANGRLDASVSAKASRDEKGDSKAVVISEGKLNVHLTDVLRLPITFSYANRETELIKHGWQLNVGVNALVDEVLRRLQ